MPVSSTLAVLLERLLQAMEALVVGLLVFGTVYLFGRLLAVPAVRGLIELTPLENTVKLTLGKITGAFFLLLGIYLALPLSGLATTPTTIGAITAGATIAVGFASRDLLSNFVSGAIIVWDPEFHVGDWIQWNDTEGIIEDIGFRVTRLHTFDNELITIPNSDLTTNAVTNPGSKDRLRLQATFGVGYDESLDQVREILTRVAHENDDIEDRPAPTVRVSKLADSAIEVTVLFWVLHPVRADTYRINSDYVSAVTERFAEEGIEMPYPHRELGGEIGTVTVDSGPVDEHSEHPQPSEETD